MATGTGLRERKKQATRLAISQAATAMFIARGFDAVTVAEVADAAGVSVNTIFNYFATKEELFFDRGDEVEDGPSRVVRERAADESPTAALRRAFRGFLTDTGHLFLPRMARFIATVDASPALRARARVLLERAEQRLAATLAADRAAPVGPEDARTIAALISGVQRVLLEELRVRILRHDASATARTALLRMTDRAFVLLEHGVGAVPSRATAAAPRTATARPAAKRSPRRARSR